MQRAYFLRSIELAVAEHGQEPSHFSFYPLGHEALVPACALKAATSAGCSTESSNNPIRIVG